mgnify:CR=1 FL=1|jgi:hypothetical protein|tara:strand:+ start:215 stop:433 length:219 start_codon:yes stop_codon:yes gene_type:complete
MAINDNVGGMQVTAIAKMTVTTVKSTMEGIAAALQTALRASPFANADVIYTIQLIRNKNSNDVIAYIIWEDN